MANVVEALKVAVEVANQTAAIVAVLTPVWGPAAAWLLPLVTSRIRNEKLRLAVEAVSHAGLQAATAAGEAMRLALEEATAPESPGGVTVVKEEQDRAVTIGVAAGMQMLARAKVLQKVVDAYGGEDAVKSALRQFILAKVPMPKEPLLQIRTAVGVGGTPVTTMSVAHEIIP